MKETYKYLAHAITSRIDIADIGFEENTFI